MVPKSVKTKPRLKANKPKQFAHAHTVMLTDGLDRIDKATYILLNSDDFSDGSLVVFLGFADSPPRPVAWYQLADTADLATDLARVKVGRPVHLRIGYDDGLIEGTTGRAICANIVAHSQRCDERYEETRLAYQAIESSVAVH
jgi:hypothetical protein